MQRRLRFARRRRARSHTNEIAEEQYLKSEAADTDIIIAAEIEGKPATATDDYAVEDNDTVTSAVIPNRASVYDLHPASNRGIF